MIKDLLEKAFAFTTELWGEPTPEAPGPQASPPTAFERGIPTLSPGVHRPVSPMLRARFDLWGRWTTASHGHWLSAADMEAPWLDAEALADPLLDGIRESRAAGAEGWPNEASTLFRPERLSLFAGSDYTYEKIYLLWLDHEDEPELWIYDANGESRYRDLSAYLRAYVSSDVSAASLSWRAGQA
jgi:hypothetical protein